MVGVCVEVLGEGGGGYLFFFSFGRGRGEQAADFGCVQSSADEACVYVLAGKSRDAGG